MTDSRSLLRHLPSVDAVLADPSCASLESRYSRAAVTEAVRAALAGLRESLVAGAGASVSDLSVENVARMAQASLERAAAPTLRRVVNATGVVLHTNLGRACLAAEAAAAVSTVASQACNLEFDLETGGRGDRDSLIEQHLIALTGAEAATVVNNNAAAVILVLNSLAEDREAVVSRGELVEIGGSFRIPDIMKKSGVVLREVGTTNRTHAKDYRGAINSQTGILLKVHTSNYRIVGFSASVPLDELVAMTAERDDLFVVEDLGAGALIDLEPLGLMPEPVVADRVATGADAVTFSGDKLLGGPQCGIIVGRKAVIDLLRRNPLKRALRCDKMTLAALEATLAIYRFGASPLDAIPTLRGLARSIDEMRPVGERAAQLLRSALGGGVEIELVEAVARTGSGSQPDAELPSLVLSLHHREQSAGALARRFRDATPPIIGRIEKDRFLLDLRLIDDPAVLVPNS